MSSYRNVLTITGLFILLLLEQSNLMTLVCTLALIVRTLQSDEIMYFREKPVTVRIPQSDDIIMYFQENPLIIRTLPQSGDSFVYSKLILSSDRTVLTITG